MKQHLKKLLVLTALSFYSLSAFSDWTLDSEKSTISFDSVKKETIKETHTFKAFSGNAQVEGDLHTAQLNIDLNSVSTNIDIRNERMKTMLFETAQFPTAKINVSVAGLALNAKQAQEITAQLEIDLHGNNKSQEAVLEIAQTEDGGLLVSTKSPVIIDAADFNLLGGIEKLKTVAALPSIKTTVPVSVNLNFKKNK